MIEYYPIIRDVHIGAVLLSGLLFVLRAFLMTRSPARPSFALWLSSLSVDTTLATAAMLLATILPAAVFSNGWLAAKLVAVNGYMVCAYGGLSSAASPSRRRLLLALAGFCYLAAVAIARTHDPLGPLHMLFG